MNYCVIQKHPETYKNIPVDWYDISKTENCIIMYEKKKNIYEIHISTLLMSNVNKCSTAG